VNDERWSIHKPYTMRAKVRQMGRKEKIFSLKGIEKSGKKEMQRDCTKTGADAPVFVRGDGRCSPSINVVVVMLCPHFP
jgi:hypothetical protein